jgi:probable phosphoglycerate mutase
VPIVGRHGISITHQQCMGLWEGKTVKERTNTSKDGQESVADMSDRVAGWWRDSIGSYARELEAVNTGGESEERRKPQHVLVVSHGYFISLLLRGLIDSGTVKDEAGLMGRWIGNASISVVELDEDGRGLLSKFADVDYLTGSQAWAGSTEAF